MHYTNRLLVAAGAFVALFLFIQTASALTLPGFPPHAPSITSPKMVKLCDRVMNVAGITLTIPRICKDTPPPPPAVPQLIFTATPSTVVAGNSSTLAWDSTDATSCTASGGWTGAKSLDGTEVVSPGATTNYVLTCVNGANSVVKDVTVTVTPAPVAPTLTLVKTLVKDDGGTAVAADFQAKIDGNNVAWDVAQTLTAGAHTVSETNLPGYTAGVWGGDCATDGTITLVDGDAKTCTITNDDQPGTLIVKKVLIQDNGRTEVASDFSFQVNTGNATAFEVDGQNDFTVDAGTHTVTEVAHASYTTTYDNCTDVVVANGASATCTITNNDIAPAPTTGTLVVDKVTQPSGDTTEFSITATGSGAITGGGAGSATDATNKSYEAAPGTYTVAETAVDGWVVVSNTCIDVVVPVGESVTCTITNAKLPKLTLTKVVTNNDGATKQVADFPLFIDGVGVMSGEQKTVSTGLHTVSETGDSMYAATIGGDCATDGTITLAPGEEKSCTITNDDIAPAVNHLLISEVHYDPDTTHGADDNEWIEIYNPTNAPVNLSTWVLADASTFDKFPHGTIIPAKGYVVASNSSTTPSFWSMPVGTVFVSFENNIGNALGNAGDVVMLQNTSGATTTVDSMSWGTNATGFVSGPAATDVEDGHSLERVSLSADTDTAADWADSAIPDPGM